MSLTDLLAQTSSSPSKTADPTVTTSNTKSGNEPQTTNLNTGGQTVTGSATGSKNGTQTTRQAFNPVDAAGGIAMLTPATTTGSALYRIGETITFVWNYTSLQGTPSAVDVLASCTTATQTVTLTQNMTWEATGTFTWDTNKYLQTGGQVPLLTAEYALIIHDSDSAVTAAAEAGYLATFDRFKFGLYASRPYSNLSEWKCATCSAANGDLDRKALGFAFTMATITILSFTWFVAGFGAMF